MDLAAEIRCKLKLILSSFCSYYFERTCSNIHFILTIYKKLSKDIEEILAIWNKNVQCSAP